ncbi:MAG: hypothetical protein AUJ51_05910 [Elusimicrobia bacterium CG1_02_56_21]|nr:MAG: hypothetical protein AUJ51_05910 [Elusimicrobia bacterium CG1_02_56_21]
MNTILIVCVITVTVAFVVLVVQAVLTLQQMRHTAKAMEYLALNADGKLTAMDPMIGAIKTASSAVSSGWFKIARTVYGLFSKE